jgi:hypothetical protein
MSKTLIEKIRKAREVTIYQDGFGFTIRRPTDMEFMTLRRGAVDLEDILRRFVVNWLDVKEIDLIPGGSPTPVPFDSELFVEWVVDRPSLWLPLRRAIEAAYESHAKAIEDTLGEPETGPSPAS